jgi:hypothetical protein
MSAAALARWPLLLQCFILTIFRGSMTAPRREQRTASFDVSEGEPSCSDFVAASAEQRADEIEPPRGPLDSANMPVDLQRALRAARTPLLAGVDFQPADAERDALPTDSQRADRRLQEKSRIDTLSPRDSLPPPAMYPAEPPPRPSVVPPVRHPYNDPQSGRSRSDPPPAGIRSDPPSRIPISDRPSRPLYRSDPPPRASRSDPPLQSSRRGPTSHRRSWDDAGYLSGDPSATSAEARRREAITIQADLRSPSQVTEFDPSLPPPSLRSPSSPLGQLTATMRRHENSRLRNVAMTMMFVIFVVSGAIAGMRWYVTREEPVPTSNEVVGSDGPRTPRIKLDRLAPNAVVAPHEANAVVNPKLDQAPPTKIPHGDQPAAKNSTLQRSPRSGTSPDLTSIPSPFIPDPESADRANGSSSALPANGTNRSVGRTNRGPSNSAGSHTSRPTRSELQNSKKIDTKTPLIAD